MMNESRKTILRRLAIVVVLIVAPIIFLFVNFFGPIDTFPRLYKTAQCSDPSWSTVAVYQKKAYWFALDTNVMVRVSDSEGNIVHEEGQIQNDHWMPQNNNQTYSGYCNKTLFVKQK